METEGSKQNRYVTICSMLQFTDDKIVGKDGKWYKKIRACNYIDEKNNLENMLPKGQGIKINIEY